MIFQYSLLFFIFFVIFIYQQIIPLSKIPFIFHSVKMESTERTLFANTCVCASVRIITAVMADEMVDILLDITVMDL